MDIFGNKVKIRKQGRKFYGSFSKNLNELFCVYRGGVARALRKQLRKRQLVKSPIQISFKSTNVQLSLTILIPFPRCVENLLVILEKQYGIENCAAEEEANVTTPLPWQQVVKYLPTRTFRSISVRLQHPSVHIKFQPSKKRNGTQCSAILGGFSWAGTKLIQHLEQICGDGDAVLNASKTFS